ncbi:MAG: radical SAM protein [Candidatus Riflebacteria bacterium]|nr:radical SAM protein [Candidatus Riflebacteria bacterium]
MSDFCLNYPISFEKLIRENRIEFPLNYRHFVQTGVIAKTPRSVSLETTATCQLSCKMCDRGGIRRKTMYMPDEVFIAAIRNLAPYRPKLNFNGMGEPLLDEKLPERIAYAGSHGFDILGLVTNGLLLTPQISRELIAAGIRRITISLDGNDQASHESGHTTASYQAVTENIESLVRISRELFAEHLEIVLRVTIQKKNLASIPSIFMRWHDKVSFIKVNFVYQYGNVQTDPVVPFRWKERIPCPSMLSGLMILTNGDTTICCMGDINADLRVGNVTSDRLDKLYSGEIAQSIRNKHLSGDLESLPVCQRCAGCTISSFYFGTLARSIETECMKYVNSAAVEK